MIMEHEAILSSKDEFTSFKYGKYFLRFKTSPWLEKYTQIVEWDNGYIDLIPVLEHLFIEPDEFLKPIKKVRISYD